MSAEAEIKKSREPEPWDDRDPEDQQADARALENMRRRVNRPEYSEWAAIAGIPQNQSKRGQLNQKGRN